MKFDIKLKNSKYAICPYEVCYLERMKSHIYIRALQYGNPSDGNFLEGDLTSDIIPCFQ